MKSLIFLTLVLAAVASCVQAKQTQCYQCFYTEENGNRKPGSKEACKDPEEDEDDDLSIEKCTGKCFVQHEKDGKDEHWKRGCMKNCKNDKKEGITCCDGDLCNSAHVIRPTLAITLGTALIYWINTLNRN